MVYHGKTMVHILVGSLGEQIIHIYRTINFFLSECLVGSFYGSLWESFKVAWCRNINGMSLHTVHIIKFKVIKGQKNKIHQFTKSLAMYKFFSVFSFRSIQVDEIYWVKTVNQMNKKVHSIREN